MASRIDTHTLIAPGTENGVRPEVFADLLEAKVLVEDYRDHYNHQRPHSALGYLTPVGFVAAADLGGKEENTGKQEELVA